MQSALDVFQLNGVQFQPLTTTQTREREKNYGITTSTHTNRSLKQLCS